MSRRDRLRSKVEADMAAEDDSSSARPVVLFYTDNGIGLGHLTRQLAIALRSRGAFQPLFLTMSAGFTLPRSAGIPTEYFPSYGRLDITKPEWEPMIMERLLEVIEATDTRAVVVDHVSPPRIFAALRERAPRTRFIWSRRGLWQPDKNRAAVSLSDEFDLVVEPGDVASVIDQGATTAQRSGTVSTAPVVMVDPADYVPAHEARDALGIPREGRAVLVNVGDRSSDEVRRMIDRATQAIRRHGGRDTHVFAPMHPLHGGEVGEVPGIHMAAVYPVARFFNAFDAVVSSSGYNSFHEVVASGLPAVFVPHRGARIDDQYRRAEFASLCGRSQWAANIFSREFDQAVRRMLRPYEPEIARRTTELLGSMNGAEEFAEVLAGLVAERPGPYPTGARTSAPTDHTPALDRVVVALDLDGDELGQLVATWSPDDIARTVVVTRDADPGPIYGLGVVFETILDEDEWRRVGDYGYGEYVAMRLAGIERRYGTTQTIMNPLETKVKTQ